MVGRVWACLVRYAEMIERFGIEGPFEISLALLRTKGATIKQFGAGWAEPGSAWWDGWRICGDDSILLLQELDRWPDREGCKARSGSALA